MKSSLSTEKGTAAVMPYAFAGCRKLKRAVTSGELCDGAFLGCEKLTDVKIGNYVRIRSYIKREGKPELLYSKWSDKKKVKTS